MKNIVVVSVYDGGYGASFMENGKINVVAEYKSRLVFKERFGKDIDRITIDDLAKFYKSDTLEKENYMLFQVFREIIKHSYIKFNAYKGCYDVNIKWIKITFEKGDPMFQTAKAVYLDQVREREEVLKKQELDEKYNELLKKQELNAKYGKEVEEGLKK